MIPLIVAEIGINYRDDASRALAWISILARSGVDAVTLQIREDAFNTGAESWRHRLPDEFYSEAASVAHAHSLMFGIAIAESSRIASLDRFGVDFWKTLSWDLLNDDIQSALVATGKRVFASTGISSLEEVVECVTRYPRVEFIHTQLDLAVSGVNLKAIDTIRKATGRDVAFGLHCRDHEVLTLALAFQVSAIFFYVRDSGAGDYPDRDHALTLESVPMHAERLKRLAPAVGSGRKEAAPLPKDGKL